MTHYYLIDKDRHLAHSGTKGMKWGVRRYQNYDGTYTPEGLERYWPGSKHGERGGLFSKSKSVLPSISVGQFGRSKAISAISTNAVSYNTPAKKAQAITGDCYNFEISCDTSRMSDREKSSLALGCRALKKKATGTNMANLVEDEDSIGYATIADLANQGYTASLIKDLCTEANDLYTNHGKEVKTAGRNVKSLIFQLAYASWDDGTNTFIDKCCTLKNADDTKSAFDKIDSDLKDLSEKDARSIESRSLDSERAFRDELVWSDAVGRMSFDSQESYDDVLYSMAFRPSVTDAWYSNYLRKINSCADKVLPEDGTKSKVFLPADGRFLENFDKPLFDPGDGRFLTRHEALVYAIHCRNEEEGHLGYRTISDSDGQTRGGEIRTFETTKFGDVKQKSSYITGTDINNGIIKATRANNEDTATAQDNAIKALKSNKSIQDVAQLVGKAYHEYVVEQADYNHVSNKKSIPLLYPSKTKQSDMQASHEKLGKAQAAMSAEIRSMMRIALEKDYNKKTLYTSKGKPITYGELANKAVMQILKESNSKANRKDILNVTLAARDYNRKQARRGSTVDEAKLERQRSEISKLRGKAYDEWGNIVDQAAYDRLQRAKANYRKAKQG